MLKVIITMYENSQRAISESSADKKITWAYIKTTLAHCIEKVKAAKFEDPKRPAAELKAHYDVVAKEIEDAFLTIQDN